MKLTAPLLHYMVFVSMPKNTCKPKASLSDRKLLSTKEAIEIADLFAVLANDTRLRLLHVLAMKEELCVSDIAERLAMKPQAISNQIQRLVDKRVLESRREGNSIFYRIINPCVPVLLERGWCLVEESR